MKRLSFIFALVFGALAYGLAGAVTMPKPASSFDVGATHVDKYGTGEPALILIPGLTDSAAVWSGTIARFAPTHTIYALTLAGFGGTKPTQSPMIEKAVSDVVSLIAQEHLNKPVVIGHSLGGFTVLRIAEEHSDLLRGAIAVDGLPVFYGMDAMTAAQRSANAAQIAAPLANLTPDQLMAGAKTYSVPYMTQAKNVDTVVAFGKGADPAATSEYMTELISADIRPDLAKITIPLLELGPFDATLDPHNPSMSTKTLAEKQAYYQKLLSNDPTVKVQFINNSRHFIMIDQPQAFYAAVSAFLKTLP
jgi:pimeloyl-ACP methyl ester carboxylesterase